MLAELTLVDAQEWLRQRVEEGETCPCCTQFAKVYKRKITSTAAAGMIALYRSCGQNYGHIATIMNRQQGDETKLAYWELIEEERVFRPDGGRAGYWRVTDKGVVFLQNQITVPKYARVYDGRVLGLDGDEVGIIDCLGQKFNYRELMAT